MAHSLLEVEGLAKRFCRDPRRSRRYGARDILREIVGRPPFDGVRPGEFWALHGVGLTVEPGEVLGVIGANGSGKSTLINVVAGLIRPSLGRVRIRTDRVVRIDNQAGLSLVQTGRENILNKLALCGFSEEDPASAVDAIMEYAGLRQFIDAPVSTYSLGMRLRLGFSIYTRLQPELFLVDEALGGGDLRFRLKFLGYLKEYIARGGSMLLASHDLFVVQTLCRRSVLLHEGEVLATGPSEEVIHRYTELMEAAERSSPASAAMLGGSDAAVSEPGGREGASTDDAGSAESVAIRSVEVTSPDGGPVQAGGPAVVRVTCDGPVQVGPLLCFIEISHGVTFPLVSLVGGYTADHLVLAPGANTIACRAAQLPFLPGVYDVRVAVTHREHGTVLARRGYRDLPVQFEVHGDPSPCLNMVAHRKSYTYVRAEWEARHDE